MTIFGPQVPKIIYTSVPSARKVDSRLLDNWDYIKENNSGWDHFAFDDERLKDFISTNYGIKILKNLRAN
jgi:hypothetical protein